MHFDSDVVFRGNVVDEIRSNLDGGGDLVGPVRNYKHNPHSQDDKRAHPDVTQTYCFAFNRQKISRHSYRELVEMCRGGFNPLGFEVIDFFDPVGFEIRQNGGKVILLSVDKYGGEGPLGTRKNKYIKENAMIDFGSKIAHFSGVGSGMNFYRNKDSIKDVPKFYVDYGLSKYALYMKLFYDKDLKIKINKRKNYDSLFKVKKWY